MNLNGTLTFQGLYGPIVRHPIVPQVRSLLIYCSALTAILPTELALVPTTSHQLVDISDYREQLVEMLSSARTMAAKENWEGQHKYKHQYDKVATNPRYKVRD